MTEEATQPGVSTEDQEVVSTETESTEQQSEARDPSKPLTRDDRMAEVIAKRREQRETDRKAAALINNPDLTEEEYDAQQDAEQEGEDGNSPPDLESSEHDDGADSSVVEEQDEPEKETDVRQSADAVPDGWDRRDDGVLVKQLKVNGEIREVTQEQYDRLAQKVLAGDEILRRASEAKREVEQRAEELDRRTREASQPPGQSDADLDAALGEYIDAVYEGNADEAKAKLKGLLSGRQSSTPNIDQIVQAATTRVRADLEQQRRSESEIRGWQKFQETYPEISGDPEYLAATDVVLKKVVAENPDWDAEMVFMESGRRAAEKFKIGKPQPQTDDKRAERKSKLKSVPRAGSATHAPVKEPELDMSPQAKIARLRASRAVV